MVPPLTSAGTFDSRFRPLPVFDDRSGFASVRAPPVITRPSDALLVADRPLAVTPALLVTFTPEPPLLNACTVVSVNGPEVASSRPSPVLCPTWVLVIEAVPLTTD